MTLNEIINTLQFESGFPNPEMLEGWVIQTANEIARSYTSLVRYDSLFLPDFTITAAVNAQTLFPLGNTIQHIDYTYALHVRTEGGIDVERSLFIVKSFPTRYLDTTYPRYITRNQTNFTIEPSAGVLVGDRIVFSAWQFPVLLRNTQIVPAELETVIQQDLLARVKLMLGDKNNRIHRELSSEAHGRSFGVTDIGSQN